MGKATEYLERMPKCFWINAFRLQRFLERVRARGANYSSYFTLLHNSLEQQWVEEFRVRSVLHSLYSTALTSYESAGPVKHLPFACPVVLQRPFNRFCDHARMPDRTNDG